METSSKKVIYAALAGNTLIAITKFIAATITGSSAMMSEGIHSLVDTGNQGLLLYGLKRAKQPADEQFPFGYGKEIYFWSFVVALLIFALGAGISIYEGVHHIFHPEPIKNVLINYIVLGLAMFFEGIALFFALKEFKKTKGNRSFIGAIRGGKDPTLFVVLFEDSAAMLGLMVAFIGVWLTQVTGVLYFDGIASVIIGLILAGVAIWLAYETKGLLIGESARNEVVSGIRKLVSDYEEIESVNEVLTMHMGPEYILVNISVDYSNDIPVGRAEVLSAELNKAIKQQFPRVRRVFIDARSLT
ncbi:MAG: cation diffusion facilitator family transporter [Pseudomonadales bacterium]|nr:cation diffusion facilitator family transporter [Pseudomonadales bacterium]